MPGRARHPGADWAVVYYAGHGIQVGGTNYLVPVDARLRSDRDVSFEAVPLEQVMTSLSGARKIRIVVLDACRDNPFIATMKRSMASRSVGRGLAQVEPTDGGTLVAYAAKAGNVAFDGGPGNGPYASALVKNLATPDLEVEFFFRHVRADVLRATQNKQEPATYGSLPPERFVFRKAPATATPTSGTAPVVTPNATPALTAAGEGAEACDWLAASPTDADRPALHRGVVTERIDTAAAVPACQAAVAGAPSNGRIAHQLGRALYAAKRMRESKATLGSAEAKAYLGALAYKGVEGPSDPYAAKRWFEQAADEGSVFGLTGIGVLHDNGRGVEQDKAEARRWYERAMARGEPEAMASLASLMLQGHGGPKDVPGAVRLFEQSAALDYGDAMAALGLLSLVGQSVPQDDRAARRWLDRSVELESGLGMAGLGMMLREGRGGPRDDEGARYWSQKGADLGSAAAMSGLALLYENGRGVPKDLYKAREWYAKAAELGDVDGTAGLGVMTYQGLGGTKDITEARRLLQKAAGLGNAYAMTGLGFMAFLGQGLPRDDRTARSWFEKGGRPEQSGGARRARRDVPRGTGRPARLRDLAQPQPARGRSRQHHGHDQDGPCSTSVASACQRTNTPPAAGTSAPRGSAI